MSAGGGSGGEGDCDFDLNIAPIIDCFTVLIAYLLLSASFISVGILDVGVVTASEQTVAAAVTDPGLSLVVEVGIAKNLEIKVSGRETASFTIPAAAGGDWDYAKLGVKMLEVKQKWPAITEASINAGAAVEYRDVVRAIEVLRKSLPKVYLGETA